MHAFRQRQQVLTPPERVVLRWTLNSSAGRPLGSTSTTWASTSSIASEGSGPTLLLIHGYPFNSWDWAPIWDRLTDRFTVVAPDMLGMGFSDKPVAYEYSVHDHADMHEALLVRPGRRVCAHPRPRHRRLGRPGAVGAPRVRPAGLRGAAHRVDHLAQRRPVQRGLHPAAAAEGAVANAVGGLPESAAGQPDVAAHDRADHQRVVRARHQTVAPDARPVPRDPRVQRRQAGDAQGRQVRQRPLRASQSVGAGDAANRHPDAADRRARRPELGQAHGAALPRGHPESGRRDARRQHRALAADRGA